MKSIVLDITCPHCGCITHNKSETLLMHGFESGYIEDLLNGDFFKKTCPICGQDITYMHPLLYVDKEHNFLILLKSKTEITKEDALINEEDTASRKRFITNVNDIKDKIRIFEDGLDDRIIAIIKEKLYRKSQLQEIPCREIRYVDYDEASHTLWFDAFTDQFRVVAVEMATYEALAKLVDEDSHTFLEIGREWAQDWIQQHSL